MGPGGGVDNRDPGKRSSQSDMRTHHLVDVMRGHGAREHALHGLLVPHRAAAATAPSEGLWVSAFGPFSTTFWGGGAQSKNCCTGKVCPALSDPFQAFDK